MWGGAGNVRIINLLTQEGGYEHGARPGKATVSHVNHCLRELVKMIKKENITSLALPKIATGVGGLEWSEVWPMIQDKLSELDIPVYVYTRYQKDMQAIEPA